MSVAPDIESKFVIVTGADARYFELVSEQIASIRRLPQGADAALAVLDGGLEPGQRQALEDLGARIKPLDWPDAATAGRYAAREYLKINLNKPCLDRLFPEFEVMVWLDGDAWLQTWEAIDLLVAVARKGKLAIVSQASRLQRRHIGLRRRLFGWVEPRGILFKNARRARLPKRLAWSLVDRPVLNTGAYALSRAAPHWEAWRAWQERCIAHGRAFTSDQLALALAVYEDGLAFEALPETCNYMGPWRWDEARGALVHEFAPYEPVSVVHLAALEELRRDRLATVRGLDMEDRPIDLPLRFSAFRQGFMNVASEDS